MSVSTALTHHKPKYRQNTTRKRPSQVVTSSAIAVACSTGKYQHNIARKILPPSIGKSGNSPFAPHIAQVLVAPGSTRCKTDMALLVLDRSLDDATIAPIRLDHEPSLGEHLTATGWGFTSGKLFATREA